MSPAGHARVKEIFLAVCALPANERSAALERECAGDVELRSEVESLLVHHQDESILVRQSTHQGAPRIVELAFADGASAKWHEEQRRFLHQRLRVWVLVLHLLIGIVLLRVFSFLDSWSVLSTISKIGVVVGCVGFSSLSILPLALRSPSFLWLRRIELALVAMAAFAISSWSYGWLTNGISDTGLLSSALKQQLASSYWVVSSNRSIHFRAGPGLISFPVANYIAMVTGLYGIVIPHTLRRIIAIILLMLLLVVVTILAAASVNPHLRPYVLSNIVSSCAAIGASSCVCAYVGLKFQALRRAVFDAKQVGQYQLTRLLGKGAMGEVYLGQHRLLRRPCAVKLIRAEQGRSREALLRFEREVQAMAQLTHPNTVEIYDFGRTEDDSFFYAMEYLPGTTLDVLVRTHGPLPPGRVVFLLMQICSALAEAHQKGLVHRDIKPSNIFVCERGGTDDVIKLLDFGLVHVRDPAPLPQPTAQPVRAEKEADESRAADSDAPLKNLTQAGQLLGTPAYMSPEQIEEQQPDARSDIYSLGGVACFLLSSHPPFERETLAELYSAHLHAPVPSLREQCLEIPPDLEAVIVRCLAKSPADRFQDVEAVATALSATRCASDWSRAQAKAWWQAHPLPSANVAASPSRQAR